MEPYIGLQLWSFDNTIREYERDGQGRAVGGALWRSKWVPVVIHAETSRSWVIGPERWKDRLEWCTKVPKKDFPGPFLFTIEDIDKAEFIHNRFKLFQRVDKIRDYDLLKELEALIEKSEKIKTPYREFY